MSVSFSPDSKYIVSGSGDKTIKLWNTETQQLLKTFEGH
jgi:WD40 repeat protein